MKPTPKERVLKTLARSTGAQFEVSIQNLKSSQSEVMREEDRLLKEQRAMEATMSGNRKMVESGKVLNPAILIAGGQSGMARRHAIVEAQQALSEAELRQQGLRAEADRLKRRIDKLDEFSLREASRRFQEFERKEQIDGDDRAATLRHRGKSR